MKILETERFILREFELSDAGEMYKLNLDPEVIKYTGDPPFESIEATRQFLLNYDQYEKYGYGRWAVIRKTDNEFMGWCGLKFNPEYGETNLGYRFFRCYWGQGIATETAKACLAYGFGHLKLAQIAAYAVAENGASIKIMQKIGMAFREKRDCANQPGVKYLIESSEQN